jgi:phosphohistidine phosphatase SixA
MTMTGDIAMKTTITRLTLQALAATLLMGTAAPAFAQKAIVLVRHTEKVDESADPLLSEKGLARADALAKALASMDIKEVYTTQYQRTWLTAEPVMKARGLQPVKVQANAPAELIARMKKDHPQDIVLTVGHSNSVPNLLKLLGVTEEIKIADDEFSNIFIVVPAASGAPTLLRLRY